MNYFIFDGSSCLRFNMSVQCIIAFVAKLNIFRVIEYKIRFNPLREVAER